MNRKVDTKFGDKQQTMLRLGVFIREENILTQVQELKHRTGFADVIASPNVYPHFKSRKFQSASWI